MHYPLYALALFTSAALLFVVQPMAARLIQPALGGTPAVWNTVMVFFQAILLAGYLYAHLSTKWLGTHRQAIFHLVVIFMGLLFLPFTIGPPADTTGLDTPALWVFTTLCLAIGWPVFVVATSAPLLQKWFSDTEHTAAADPYYLYAASNLGSLVALLAYPTILEPRLGLSGQTMVWMAAYLVVCAAVCLCAASLWWSPDRPTSPESATEPPAAPRNMTWKRRLRWLVWAFIPSSLMLSVTTFLSTDLAPVPLVWIPPLTIYIASFILAFSRSNPIPNRWWLIAVPPALLVTAVLLATETLDPLWAVAIAKLGALFVICIALHGLLADDRPSTGSLTEFYLWLAIGGVFGGIFNALIAPVAFDALLELPIVLALSALAATLAIHRWLDKGLWARFLWSACALTGLVFLSIMIFEIRPAPDELHIERSYFGVHRVEAASGGDVHLLYNGRTIHGAQIVADEYADIPLMYYHPTGPLGQVFAHLSTRQERHPVAAIGLGAGSLATYAVDGQVLEFFEIDRAVVEIAEDERLFSYLERCAGKCRVTIGDGRLLVEASRDGHFELIVVDAYSSAAIPVHLLTLEAVATYVQKLRDDGILAIHISSPYLDLEPPLTKTAEKLGLVTRFQRHEIDKKNPLFDRYVDSSEWLLIARDEAALGQLAADPRWLALEPVPAIRPWTDDYANIWGAFRR